jgi:hypothetical protein
MASLIPVNGDSETRVACSECLKLGAPRHLFEVPDRSVEHYELRGEPGRYERRENSPTPAQWESAPSEGEVMCVGCAQRDRLYRRFSLADGSETFLESFGADPRIPRS